MARQKRRRAGFTFRKAAGSEKSSQAKEERRTKRQRTGDAPEAAASTSSGSSTAAAPDASAIIMPSAQVDPSQALDQLVSAALEAEAKYATAAKDKHIVHALHAVSQQFKAKLQDALPQAQSASAPKRVVNPANEQLRRKKAALHNAMRRLSKERDAWQAALKEFRSQAPEPLRDENVKPLAAMKLADELPKTAQTALNEFDLGMEAIEEAMRKATDVLRSGRNATSQLSSKFYAATFRDVPHHEQPVLAVRALTHQTAGGSVASTKAITSGSGGGRRGRGASAGAGSGAGAGSVAAAAAQSPAASRPKPFKTPRSSSSRSSRRSTGKSRRRSVRGT